MGFFKDFKDDLTQAVNEKLPDDVFTDNEDDSLFTGLEAVDTLEGLDLEKNEMNKHILMDQMEQVDKIDANVEAFLQKVKALDEGKDMDDDMDFKLDDVMLSEDELLFTDTLDDTMDHVKDDAILGGEDDANLTLEDTDVDTLNFTEAIDEAEVENIISSMRYEEDKMITEIANEKQQMDDVVGLTEVKEERVAPTGDATVIGKNTVINGSITSGGSLEVYGKVEGDIECGGKLTINGVVKGNSKAQEVFVNAKRLEGNVESSGNIKVGQGTVVVGDINASAGVIAGAIKGQIDINGAVVLDSTAIVKGNIKAKSVQINNGAVVDGYCSLLYAEVDLDNVFDE